MEELPPLPEIKIGRYQHYKGKPYQVLGVARHSETLESMVVYQKLYDDQSLWVRPFAMFVGDVVVDGNSMPRFKYLGSK